MLTLQPVASTNVNQNSTLTIAAAALSYQWYSNDIAINPQNDSARMIVDQLSLCLFAEYLNSALRAASDSVGDQPVNRFLCHIEEHFGDDDCLLQAHRAAGISRNGLILKFHDRMQNHTGPLFVADAGGTRCGHAVRNGAQHRRNCRPLRFQKRVPFFPSGEGAF
jgi:hypothetical protein